VGQQYRKIARQDLSHTGIFVYLTFLLTRSGNNLQFKEITLDRAEINTVKVTPYAIN